MSARGIRLQFLLRVDFHQGEVGKSELRDFKLLYCSLETPSFTPSWSTLDPCRLAVLWARREPFILQFYIISRIFYCPWDVVERSVSCERELKALYSAHPNLGRNLSSCCTVLNMRATGTPFETINLRAPVFAWAQDPDHTCCFPLGDYVVGYLEQRCKMGVEYA